MAGRQFIEMAFEGRNEWWRYVATLFLVLFGWQFIGVIPLFVYSYLQADGMQEWVESAENAFLGLGINSNLYLLLIIFSFIGGLVFLLLGVRSIHRRRLKTLVSTRQNVDWKRVLFGFAFWSLLSVALIFLDYLSHPEDFVNNFKFLPFLVLVVISLLFIPFQTSFEELLFRGYLMQGLGLLFRNAYAPLFLTSVGFGLLHAFNPEVEKLGYMILLYYIGTGFLFGIITLMDQGTELALGMHAANNIVAAVIVTVDWAVFQTEALLIDQSEPSLGVEMLFPLLIVYPIAIVFLSRKYGWKDWKQRLAGRIEEPSQMIPEEEE
jgi:membrane protease YdiL (CAAX protease family)